MSFLRKKFIYIYIYFDIVDIFYAEAVCIGNFWMQFWRKQFFFC